jgi:hypothetical protein
MRAQSISRPSTLAEALERCRQRAQPHDRLVAYGRAAAGGFVEDRSDRLQAPREGGAP